MAETGAATRNGVADVGVRELPDGLLLCGTFLRWEMKDDQYPTLYVQMRRGSRELVQDISFSELTDTEEESRAARDVRSAVPGTRVLCRVAFRAELSKKGTAYMRRTLIAMVPCPSLAA